MTGAVRSAPAPGSRRRVRRPDDLVRLGSAAAALVLLVLATVRAPDVVGALVGVVPTVDGEPLRAVVSVASAVASLVLLGVLITVAVDAARHRRG